jgi:hypothetical protein
VGTEGVNEPFPKDKTLQMEKQSDKEQSSPKLLPRPIPPGLLRVCPDCRRWFALKFVTSVNDDQQGTLKTYRCKYCKTEFKFASRHPDGSI